MTPSIRNKSLLMPESAGNFAIAQKSGSAKSLRGHSGPCARYAVVKPPPPVKA
jgi:hypothetical protein